MLESRAYLTYASFFEWIRKKADKMFHRGSMILAMVLLAAICTGCSSSDSENGSESSTADASDVTGTSPTSEPAPESAPESAPEPAQETLDPSPQSSEDPSTATIAEEQEATISSPPVQIFEGRPASPAVRREYEAALALYYARQPEKAIRRFDAFINEHPDSKLLPNAFYWKAECLYFQEKYPEAIFQFKDITVRFPGHPKAADALLKAGMSYAHLEDTDNAKLHYRALSQDYPKSEAARKGKKFLGE